MHIDMESILAEVLTKHCDSPDKMPLLQAAYDKYLVLFEDEWEHRVRKTAAELEETTSAAVAAVLEPVALHEKKLTEFVEKLKYFQADAIVEAETNHYFTQVNRRTSQRHSELKHERANLDSKFKSHFRLDPPHISTHSPLDQRVFRDKLEIAAKLAEQGASPGASEAWLEQFKIIDAQLAPLVVSKTDAKSDTLGLLETAFAHLPEEAREAVLTATEGWLADRCVSSTDVRKLVDAQTRLQSRHSRFKYGNR